MCKINDAQHPHRGGPGRSPGSSCSARRHTAR
jgi:hypothetical protein